MPRVLVTGSRSWYCPGLAVRILERLVARYGPDLVIVEGGATGFDRSFAEACRKLGVPDEPHPAHWEAIDRPGAVVRRRRDGTPYDAAAGPERNREMTEAGADFCIAGHCNLRSSKGTLDCVRRCLAAGIPVYLIEAEDAEPRRIMEV